MNEYIYIYIYIYCINGKFFIVNRLPVNDAHAQYANDPLNNMFDSNM